jgi:hypothetical protein
LLLGVRPRFASSTVDLVTEPAATAGLDVSHHATVQAARIARVGTVVAAVILALASVAVALLKS